MIQRAAATIRALLQRPRAVAVLELAGLGLVCYGVSGWSVPGAWIAGGVGLVLEAYAVENR